MAGDKVVGGSSYVSKDKIHQEGAYNENLSLENEFIQPIEYVPCPDFQFSTVTCCFCNGYYGPCFEEPVCPTCHAFLFPNEIGLLQVPIFSEKTDDEDSGNDEPTELYYNHERRVSQQQQNSPQNATSSVPNIANIPSLSSHIIQCFTLKNENVPAVQKVHHGINVNGSKSSAVVSENMQLLHDIHSNSMQNVNNENDDTHHENHKENVSTFSSECMADGELHSIVSFQRVKELESCPQYQWNYKVKIAEKKQHEPIVIEVKPKNEEPERLLTKKQMKEYAKEKEWRERKEQRSKLDNMNNKEGSNVTAAPSKPNKVQDNRNGANNPSKTVKVPEKLPTIPKISPPPPKVTAPQCSTSKKIIEKPTPNKSSVNKCNVPKTSERDMLLEERKKLESERKKLEEMRQAIEEEKKKLKLSKTQIEEVKNTKPEKVVPKLKMPERQELPKNPQKKLPATGVTKCHVPPTMNGKIKQFPPPDLKPLKSKNISALREQKKSLINHKRRITDDAEGEEEYDSELEDFIDDEVEGTEDYSKYISEIFGYDKNKYKYADNEDDDDGAMESSFAQQLKEEYVSTKIGIMEDLEDMRQEAMEKKRKALLKRKLKK